MNNLYQFNHPATGCMKCPALLPGRHHVVWSRGPAQAPIMAIGEAPGYNEDVEGLPFIGRSGQYMDRMLLKAGIAPQQVHIANRIMCRPPGNRDPEPDEVANCLPWLVEHIRMVEPKAILLFGRFALELFFDKNTVKDTLGLMHTSICYYCGGIGGEHQPERGWAKDGQWLREPGWKLYDPFAPPQVDLPETFQPIDLRTGGCGMKMHPIVVAAIYHPAYVGRDAPEHEPTVIKQLTRLRDELNRMGITFDEEDD